MDHTVKYISELKLLFRCCEMTNSQKILLSLRVPHAYVQKRHGCDIGWLYKISSQSERLKFREWFSEFRANDENLSQNFFISAIVLENTRHIPCDTKFQANRIRCWKVFDRILESRSKISTLFANFFCRSDILTKNQVLISAWFWPVQRNILIMPNFFGAQDFLFGVIGYLSQNIEMIRRKIAAEKNIK